MKNAILTSPIPRCAPGPVHDHRAAQTWGYHREFLLSAQFFSLVFSEQGLENPGWQWAYSVPYCRYFWSCIILDGVKTLLGTLDWMCFHCQWPLEIYNCHTLYVSSIPERGVRDRVCGVGYSVPRMPWEIHEGKLGGHSKDMEPQNEIRTKQPGFEKPAESNLLLAAW